jgi:hypothetical protein
MPILFKIIAILFLITILFSLGSALYYMSKGTNQGQMVKALSWRIGLSLLLFLFLLTAILMGWVHPQPTIIMPPH